MRDNFIDCPTDSLDEFIFTGDNIAAIEIENEMRTIHKSSCKFGHDDGTYQHARVIIAIVGRYSGALL